MSSYDPTVPNLSPRSTLEELRARRKNPSSPALARGGSDSMSDLMAYGQQLESADGAPMLPESRRARTIARAVPAPHLHPTHTHTIIRHAPTPDPHSGNDDDGAAYAPAADAFDAAAGESPSLLQVWLCMLAAMELPIIVHSIATADPLDSDAAERLYTRCVLALLRLLAAAAADRHVLAAVATVHILELALLGYEARLAHSPPVCTARQRRTPIAPAISGPSPLSILPSPGIARAHAASLPRLPPLAPLCGRRRTTR